MSNLTPGKRVERPEGLLAPGEYAKHPNGEWFGCTPNDHLAGLANHNVVEHGDGTITVAPSVLVSGERGSDDGIMVLDPDRPYLASPLWHGYLERGVWREV